MSTHTTAQCPPWCQTHYAAPDQTTLHTATFGIFKLTQQTGPDSVEQAIVTTDLDYTFPESAAELEHLVADYRDALTACLNSPRPRNPQSFTPTMRELLQ